MMRVSSMGHNGNENGGSTWVHNIMFMVVLLVVEVDGWPRNGFCEGEIGRHRHCMHVRR